MKIIESKPLRGTIHLVEDNGVIERYFRLTRDIWFKEVIDEWQEVPFPFKIKELEGLYQGLKVKWENNY
jgi:hypothetical protein